MVTAILAVGMIGCDSGSKPIVVVWYPNESAGNYDASRAEFAKLIEQATGRKVVNKTTTDYALAIQALANGQADIGAVMGAVGYIEAKNTNPKVDLLVVNSGKSGTLDDARYFSWICVSKEDAEQYKDANGNYSIDNIQGKKMSFVSNSSTSGFRVPTNGIISHFGKTDQWKDINEDAVLGLGSTKFFSEVMFGQSHQGSAKNLVAGNADVAAFCDIEIIHYIDLKEGTLNQVGSVYAVKQNAEAPFNTEAGKEFVVIASTPVLNGPYAYNPQNLSADEIKAIQDLLTSDAVANNDKIFFEEGGVGFYKKEGNNRYVRVEDSWYDPIRNMG